MASIGFIGLGNMGVPMALNLRNAGHDVRGFDVSDSAREAAGEKGLDLADSNAHAASNADIVILMLPDGPIVEVVAGEVLKAMQKGALLIDCSTIDVATARKVHEQADAAGVLCLDAPVSGGVVGAEAGTLTFMVGGSDAAFEKGAPLFDIMGNRGVHCGEGGAGQAAKICNNMLLGVSMIGACEAFALANKLGLSQSALFDVVSTSSGSCWSVNTYCPVPGVGPQSPADNAYKPGFAAALMLKDLGLSQQAADDCDAATPLGRHATDLYAAMVDAGKGGADFSGIIEYIQTHSRKALAS
ncbi:MAG: 3-hydroxyisobutyrate dehydrogenase [Hyphomicrobiaceae bacterium]|nr:3-hydroxyisobutyrate dehydrogenase [Hyphomicrobiaceae bacterium]